MSPRFLILFTLLLRGPVVTGTEAWTFERALQHAAAHSPDARIAQHRIAVAQAQLAAANSAFWPRLRIESSYTRSDNPMLAFGSILNQQAVDSSLQFNDVPETDNVNLRGLVTAPLYAGGRNTAGRNAAKADARAAQFEQIAVRRSLEFEVARAFYTILKTREFVRSTEAAVRSLEASVVVAERRFNAGALLKPDLLDLEVRLAHAREDLVYARNARILAERALQNLLGIETHAHFAISDALPTVTIPQDAIDERAELLILQHRDQAARSRLRSAQAGYKPRLSAFGSVDYDYGPITGGDGQSYSVGVVAQWDLWDGFATRSKVKEAEAEIELVREETRKMRLAIYLEIEQARLHLAASADRLLASDKAVSQASESLALTRNRFGEGALLSAQLIDAETALLSARVRRAEAETDQRISIAALRKALGLPQLDSNLNSTR